MTLGASNDSRLLITLVLRIWDGGPHRQTARLRLQATHVQTGEVAYFQTIEGATHYIERLAHGVIRAPIDLSEARQRSNNNG